MRTNPIFQEGVQVYLFEGRGFEAYFYFLVILAPIEFLAIFIPSLDPQTWTGPVHLFRVSSVAALILVVYLGLRIANQEFVPWRFLPLKHWLHQEKLNIFTVGLAQLSVLCLQLLIFLLLSAPLLIWAGAISRVTPRSLLFTFLLLFFYGLSYCVWGLVTAALWERRLDTRQAFLRSFIVCLVIFSALFFPPLNPVVFLLSYLGREETVPVILWGHRWSALAIQFLFHLLLLGSGLTAYGWVLSKERNN